MDFSETISHAIIRGLCNRAEGGREGSDKKGRLSLMVGERGELGCQQGWARLQGEGWVCISSHRQHNQRQKRSSGVLDFCKEDDKEPHNFAANPLSTAASWGAWAWAEERQDEGLLQCNPQCWSERESWSQDLIWDGIWARVAAFSHISTWGPGDQGLSGHRMMTLGFKSESLSSKLLGNYFLVGNCRENTQPFNLRKRS